MAYYCETRECYVHKGRSMRGLFKTLSKVLFPTFKIQRADNPPPREGSGLKGGALKGRARGRLVDKEVRCEG